MKNKSVFVCTECGYQSASWLGKCPGCGSWNTLEEMISEPEPEKKSWFSSALGDSAARIAGLTAAISAGNISGI